MPKAYNYSCFQNYRLTHICTPKHCYCTEGLHCADGAHDTSVRASAEDCDLACAESRFCRYFTYNATGKVCRTFHFMPCTALEENEESVYGPVGCTVRGKDKVPVKYSYFILSDFFWSLSCHMGNDIGAP